MAITSIIKIKYKYIAIASTQTPSTGSRHHCRQQQPFRSIDGGSIRIVPYEKYKATDYLDLQDLTEAYSISYRHRP